MTEKALFPELWRELCRARPIWSVFLTKRSWLGANPRAHPERLAILNESKSLAKTQALIAGLSETQLEFLEQLADVNRRQATVASRRTLVLNLTAPIGLVIGIAQIFPEAASRFVAVQQQDLLAGDIATAFIVLALISIFTCVLTAHIRAIQAEDLHDLIASKLICLRYEQNPTTPADTID